MIVEKIIKEKRSGIKNYPVNSNRASMIGHPCLRYLVLYRSKWQERTLITPHLKLIFELGNVFEKKAIKDMLDAGVEVFALQQSFKDEALNLTAHTDGLIRDEEGEKSILEIKSSSPMVLPRINSVDDMLNSNYTYMKKYPYQMETYLMMSGLTRGVWLFVNKSTGEYKEFIQHQDLNRQEEIKGKCRSINEHLKNATIPDCIEYENATCGRCDMAHVCNPSREQTEVCLEENDSLLEALTRREELREIQKEYNQIDKYVKGELRGKNGVLGDFMVESRESKRKGFAVEPTTSITVKITKM